MWSRVPPRQIAIDMVVILKATAVVLTTRLLGVPALTSLSYPGVGTSSMPFVSMC